MTIVERLRELMERATPEPWDAVVSTGCVRYLGRPLPGSDHGDYVANCRGMTASADNAELIATMRAALPALVEVAERARAVVEDAAYAEAGDLCDVTHEKMGPLRDAIEALAALDIGAGDGKETA